MLTNVGSSKPGDDDMTNDERPTTEYGTWATVKRFSLTVEQYVAEALGDYCDDYDINAVVDDYRDAINAALPAGVWLSGDRFYGPFGEGDVDLAAVVESVDLDEIAQRHAGDSNYQPPRWAPCQQRLAVATTEMK